jgi:hypothetical protein
MNRFVDAAELEGFFAKDLTDELPEDYPRSSIFIAGTLSPST